MNDAAFVVAADGEAGGVLYEVLEHRGRPVHRVDVGRGDRLPDQPDDVRALVLVGSVDTAATELLVACHQAAVPVLALGTAARAVASLDGGQVGEASTSSDGETPKGLSTPGAAGDGITLVTVSRRPAAEDDPVVAAVADGMQSPASTASRPVDEPPGSVALADDADGGIVALRVGESTYGLWLRPDLEPADVLEHADAEAQAGRAAPFIRAHGAALIGRFVDQVVGRTEAEAPWGRRGPPPKPAPGLFLNPA